MVIFSSPDETAVSAFAKAWNETGVFRLPHGLPSSIAHLVGLHGRSMVRQGEWLVPVGFLGMPFLAALANRVRQGWSAYLTAVLVLSSAIPLWFLVRRYLQTKVAWWSVLVYLSFPTILLYANRGLFPNLPVVACTLWSMWLIQSAFASNQWKCALFGSLGGLALGLALLIRPIEAIWIAPWVLWSGIEGVRRANAHWKKQWMLPCLSCCVMLLIVIGYGAVLAKQTYPYHASWKNGPVAGYLLHDRDDAFANVTQADAAVAERSIGSLLPIGFHPRTMWQNVRVFLFGIFGVWIAMALFGFILIQRRVGWKRSFGVTGVIAWTGAVLLLMYGQTVYADNINGTATIGNSFLRYLLPLVPLIAIGCAIALDRLRGMAGYRGVILSFGIGCFLILFGCSSAYARDDESIIATQKELLRYASIRHQAEQTLTARPLILSERSDKIFAGSFPVASPLPDVETISALARSGATVLIFHRSPSSNEDIPASLRELYPIERWAAIFRADREGLYYLVPSQTP